MLSRLVISNSLRPHGLQPTRLLCLQNSPGKTTVVSCHFLLQGIFPTQGSNPGLLHCRRILYYLSHKGSRQSILAYDINLHIYVLLHSNCTCEYKAVLQFSFSESRKKEKKKHNPQPHSNVDRILVCFRSKSKIWRVNHLVLPFTEHGRRK